MLDLVLNDCIKIIISGRKILPYKILHTYLQGYYSSLEVPLFVHKARRFYKSLIRKFFNGRLLHNQFA